MGYELGAPPGSAIRGFGRLPGVTSRRPRAAPAHPKAELVVGRIARLDHGRRVRTGVPEIVLAEGKRTDHLVAVLRRLKASGHGALVSRPTAEQRAALGKGGSASELGLEPLAHGRLWRLPGPLGGPPPPGLVALLTAGTADVPVADEARELLGALDIRTVEAYDVGVAGLHRLLRALRRLEHRRPQVYLVFAGREGALPTVVAGLVAAPVVGIPTSVGYGRGGRGDAALGAMLQSCAPLAVVNVDAAVPAALFAVHLLEGARRARDA